MNELTPYEDEQRKNIREWESKEPSIVEKAGGYVFKPVSWLLNLIIPKKVLEGILITCNSLGGFLADKGDIQRDGKVDSILKLRSKDLELSDKLADEVHNWAVSIATAEGGAAGYFGLAGMAIDIPTLMTLAYRTMHKIGLCYGYECSGPEDRMFLNYIMSAANANTIKEKMASVVALQQINVMIAKMTWKKMMEKAASDKFSKEAFVILIKQLSKSLGENLTKRKAAQAVPYVGGAVGAAMNAAFMNDVAWAARRSFQKRWLIENGKIVLDE